MSNYSLLERVKSLAVNVLNQSSNFIDEYLMFGSDRTSSGFERNAGLTAEFIDDTVMELYIGRSELEGHPSLFDHPDVDEAIRRARLRNVQVIENTIPRGASYMVGGRPVHLVAIDPPHQHFVDWRLSILAMYSGDYKHMLVLDDLPKTAEAFSELINKS